jgi:four helix bundle protein
VLFVADIGWRDVTRLAQDRRTVSVADQLNRSLGSISSNVAEGYSRGTGRDRARFYEYALGSAREARDWYFKGRHVLGEALTTHRMELLSQVIKLLLTIVPNERDDVMREPRASYEASCGEPLLKDPEIARLIENIPGSE